MRLRYEKCMNSRVYKNPYQKTNDLSVLLDNYLKIMENSINKKIKDEKIKATKLITKLDTLSPLKTLIRGYSITEYNGNVVNSVKILEKDMKVNLKFHDGDVDAIII